MTTPQAAIRFVDSVGAEVDSGFYPAPVRIGQLVTLADGNRYCVSDVHWPFRVNGVCPNGQTDWEYATVSTIGVPIG